MSHEPRHVRDAAPAASDSPVVLGNNTRIYRSTRGDRASSSQSVVSAGSGDALPVGTDHGGSDRRAPPRQRSGAGSGINSNNRGVGPGGMGNLRGVSGPPPTTPPHTPGRPFSARENMQPWSPSAGGGSGGGGGGAYSDRFIPSRSASNIAGLPLLDCPPLQTEGLAGVGSEREDAAAAYSQLLRTEYLGEPGSASLASPEKPSPSDAHKSLFSPARNIFRFKAESRCVASQSPYSLSPVGGDGNFGASSSSPRRAPRKIARAPFKVLDAPSLQDDFYLNLVDWSPQNQLAVGLGSCVYLWSACTSKVTKLCDLSSPADDTICSVAWSMRGSYLAVGTNQGEVQIWDPHKIALVRTMTGHRTRAGALAWGSSVLSSGSRDRTILQRDIRSPQDSYVKLLGHKSEVCGLKWSYDDRELASGGNDNHLFVWNASSPSPVLKFTEHTAAVKAISWSPHQHGLLASGGGTADRCIRFWNTTTNTALSHVDTGSQVCNLAWSKNVNEVVSTHGYSQNQIVVWRYPTMSKLATLTGHSLRVLYLAVSPDGQTIVTGAGDETLRFWNVFPGPKSQGSVHDYSMWSLGHTQIR